MFPLTCRPRIGKINPTEGNHELSTWIWEFGDLQKEEAGDRNALHRV